MPPSRAFSIVEVLVVLGVLAILAGLLSPVLARQRRAARESVCLTQLRSHSSVIAAYAGDNRDSWPMACRVDPRGAGAIYRDHPVAPFGIVGGVWHFAILDAYAYQPFHASLICPDDDITPTERDSAASVLARSPDTVGGTLDRRISMAMYLSPVALDPERPVWRPDVWITQRQADVVYPAAKAGLVERSPFHDASAQRIGAVWRTSSSWRFTMTACDGSASSRESANAIPGVLPEGIRRRETEVVERELAKFDYTAWGVRGRDW